MAKSKDIQGPMDNEGVTSQVAFWKAAPDPKKKEAEALKRWNKKSKKEQDEIKEHFKSKNSRLI